MFAPATSYGSLRESVRNGERFRSSVELMAHLLRDQADVLVQIVRDAMTKVDSIAGTRSFGSEGAGREYRGGTNLR